MRAEHLDAGTAAPEESRDARGDDRSPNTRRGRTWTVGIIASYLGLSIMLIASQGPTTVRIAHLTLSIVLFYFIWRGARWARELCGCLFGVGALLALGLAFVVHGSPAENGVAVRLTSSDIADLRIIASTYALYSIVCCWVLLRSRDVDAFVALQHDHRSAQYP